MIVHTRHAPRRLRLARLWVLVFKQSLAHFQTAIRTKKGAREHCLPQASGARPPGETAGNLQPSTQGILMKTLTASTHLPRLLIATILGPLALGCAAVSIAGDYGDVPHTAVRFGDLDLSKPDAAAALYGRIKVAAYVVCASFDKDSRDQLDLIGLDRCVHSAVRSAVAKVNRPALSAIYNARNHDPLPMTIVAAQIR